uniref:NAAA-beta domain-containing protein n=1 Tax=Steinernema glaseri TaxID=37863 RepID=A0A1I7YSR1_9BILA
MNGVTLLLLVAGVIALDIQLPQNFWEKIPGPHLKPCMDFSNAVCTNNTTLVQQMRDDFQEELHLAFQDFEPDDVTLMLYRILKEYDWNNCSSLAKHFLGLGQLTATKVLMVVKVNVDEQQNRNSHLAPHPTEPLRRVPLKHIGDKGIEQLMFGYISVVDIEKRFYLSDVDVLYERGVKVDAKGKLIEVRMNNRTGWLVMGCSSVCFPLSVLCPLSIVCY